MAEEFDPTPYVRPPMIDVASGVALGVSLITAMPKPAPDHVRAAATKVRKDTVALQEAWAKSDSAGVPVDRRKADGVINKAWGFLLDRLESYAGLNRQRHPRAVRAEALGEILSPGGSREWLTLPYQAEWAESGKRLKRIEDEGLAKDINELAGPEFLDDVQVAHAEYGVALGVTKPVAAEAAVSLANPLRALSRSIVRYSIAVAAMAGEDAASVAVVQKALRPIDDFREGQARRITRSGGADTEPAPEPRAPAGPTTPVPEVK